LEAKNIILQVQIPSTFDEQFSYLDMKFERVIEKDLKWKEH